MTRENAKDYLPLVQALAERKTLQSRARDGWADILPTEDIWFCNPASDYRVKPEPPKPREWWAYIERLHLTREAAEKDRAFFRGEIVHVIEVRR